METTIVIGGTGGIGSAVARRLAMRGERVHLVARDMSRLAPLATEINATVAAADVTIPESLSGAIEAVDGPVKGLCYAVGSITLKTVTRLTDTEIEADFRLNALGAFHATRAALPALKQATGTGSIVLFSTVAVAQGFASHASVAMAKGAVEGLTRALAAELAPKIRVNCIAPSLTRTPLARTLTGNEQLAAGIAALHAMQRLGEPDDAAALAAFLLSPDAGWITGQIMGVDGGRSTLRTKG